MIEFKFLRDQPLQTEAELRDCKFGHKEIAMTLSRIVNQCPAPFTIGLFGRWGSGKSTIANFLKINLRSNTIPTVVFDVWKHEGDALRRTFLKEVVNQLGDYGKDFFDVDFRLDERLEQSITKTSEGKFKINWDKLKQLIYVGVIFFIVLSILGMLAYSYNCEQQFWVLIAVLLAIIFGGSFITWQNATHILTTETTSFSVERFQDPHQFEKEFKRILSKLKNKRILIVFDNLDRVTHGRALEVLSTIKTFLEPKDTETKGKEVVFLIPCDAQAIKKHIESVYGVDKEGSPFDPEEFLRKFFNSILWIPGFISSELESFARNSLKRTNAKDLDDDKVAWIITKAFRENPRQIIQFINILLGHYLLIKEREGEDRDFPEGFSPENVSQLTKYLILSQRFPKEMETLCNYNIHNLQDARVKQVFNGEQNKFIDFIDETSLEIPITNLGIFFALRRSEQEKKFPGIEAFVAFLEDKKLEEAQEYIEQLEGLANINSKEDFSGIIKTKLEAKTNPVTRISFVSSLLTILDRSGIKLTKIAYVDIYNTLKRLGPSFLHHISPQVLNRQLLEDFEDHRRDIIGQWITIFEDLTKEKPHYQAGKDFAKDLSEVFSQNFAYLDAASLERFKVILAKGFASDTSIARIFTKSADLQEWFINVDYVSAFISLITQEDIENNVMSEKLQIVNSFNSHLMTPNISQSLIQKMTEIQTSENSISIDGDRIEIKERLLNDFRDVLKKHAESFSETEASLLTVFSDIVVAGMDNIGHIDSKRAFILLLVELSNFIKEPKLTEIRQRIIPFLNSSTPKSIDYILGHVDSTQQFIEEPPYAAAFEQRALNDEPSFDYVYTKVSKEKQTTLLNKLFDKDHNIAITKIEGLADKVPNSVSIVKKIFEKIDSVATPEKGRFLRICNNLKCGNDTALQKILLSKLKTYLSSTDIGLQGIGFNAFSDAEYIDKSGKRQLIKDIFDWLKRADVTNKYQKFSIRAVSLGDDWLNEEEQGEFLQFLFEELIRKAKNKEPMCLGLELLEQFKPKYENRKENFEDIKVRINSEQDDAMKKTLIDGLVKLKPNRTNAQNREYWDWVDSQNK